MKALGALSFLMLVIVSFILLCVVAFASEDFKERHDWRQATNIALKSVGLNRAISSIDLGRLFCVWLYRVWVFLLITTLIYFFGGQYVT